MGYVEENLNPCDMYVFPIVNCRHHNVNIANYCDMQADCMVDYMLSSIVHDNDYSYFEDIEARGLPNKLQDLVNESINSLSDSEEIYHPDIVTYSHEDTQGFGFVIYCHIEAVHISILQYLPYIFSRAKRMNMSYRDYTFSEAPDRNVLRLYKGIQL